MLGMQFLMHSDFWGHAGSTFWVTNTFGSYPHSWHLSEERLFAVVFVLHVDPVVFQLCLSEGQAEWLYGSWSQSLKLVPLTTSMSMTLQGQSVT